MNIHRSRMGLVTVAGLIIIIGFLITSITSYVVSTSSAKRAILTNELPLTSDNIYSEIQRDMLRPIFVSSLMATDTFLRDWVLNGEQDEAQIRKYLNAIREEYHAVTSFFVSESSRNYYHADGILKQVSSDEPKDAWYFRVRQMKTDYEINVDPDMANADTMTIFINYKAFDYQGNYIGATGVGLTVSAVKTLIDQYQERFSRTVYFVDAAGDIVLHGPQYAGPMNLQKRPGLSELLPDLLQAKQVVEFTSKGETILFSSRFIPELNWILVVEQSARDVLAEFRSTLQINLVICAIVTLMVVLLHRRTVHYFHDKLADLAMQDGLTEIGNRRAFSFSFEQMSAQAKRHQEPLGVLLIDIDHFKSVNDRFGHMVGDQVIKMTVQKIQERLRGEDALCRWGGEEFIVLLKGANLVAAAQVAEKIRATIAESHFSNPKGESSFTASLGVAEYRSNDSESLLVARVDQALYEAKRQGRNRVILETDLSTNSSPRTEQG